MMTINKLKIFKIILIVFIVFGILIFIIINISITNTYFFASKIKLTKKSFDNCPDGKTEFFTIQGDSMEGIFKSGDKIMVLTGYYSCHEPKRKDIILYRHVGDSNPLIKIVQGIPGDRISLEKKKEGNYVFINGEPLKNLAGEPYIFDDARAHMLSIYIKDYGGIIPLNAYLILGNIPTGSLDSTRFGLVDKNNFIGKVIVDK